MRHTRLLRYVDEIARTGSIRKAAERLNITPSALNRRIQDLEEELGTPIFERLARGVRLNAAGELFVRHVRTQISDLARVRSQIEDLAGFRRGNVAIACSQALAYSVLPTAIADYRRRFPLVDFAVQMRDHQEALAALSNFEVDLALVFQPMPSPDFQTLGIFEQRLVAIMGADHPLAARDMLRLRDCAAFPLALPARSYGGRALIDEALARQSVRIEPAIESNSFEFLRTYVRHESAVTVQIEIGAPRPGRTKAAGAEKTAPGEEKAAPGEEKAAPGEEKAAPGEEKEGLVSRPIDARDIRAGQLVFGQLRGRALPVAAAKFADDLLRRLEADALTSTSAR